MFESKRKGQQQAAAKENGSAEWILEIKTTLGCVNNNEVKIGSICRVPERIREAQAQAEDKGHSYRPKIVAMGPFHRAAGSDLQIMEETKWRFMRKLFMRPGCLESTAVEKCSEAMKDIETQIRASYGEKIEMSSEEFARMMLLDGCFFLQHLHELAQNETNPASLDDPKATLRVLTDLTLLENQIPFVVLTTLSSALLQLRGAAQQPQLSEEIAKSLLKCNFTTVADEVKQNSPEEIAASLLQYNDAGAADFSQKGVYHFLHLIHLCSPDPYGKEDPREDPPKLQRCARKLQAFGITITASQTNDSQGNDDPRTVASVLMEFVDTFEFNIEFNESESERELIIPTLHIKEATEVKWRNWIAWEQIGLRGIGYKFTSYAYFFKDLVCSVHDLKLLKDRGVIRVHKEAKDEDLLIMFQSIITGEERTDSRYREVCVRLNNAEVNDVAGRCVLVFRMPWHYWRRFVEATKSQFFRLAHIFLGTAWRKAGVVSGIALFGLTITQTVYAIRAVE